MALNFEHWLMPFIILMKDYFLKKFEMFSKMMRIEIPDIPKSRILKNQNFWKTFFLLKVYQNQTQFCMDVYHFIPIQTVALLSRLLMQFVCLNTVLNPVIYALSHKEFKLGLFQRRGRPCWPHAGLDSPWGHFAIAEASVLL